MTRTVSVASSDVNVTIDLSNGGRLSSVKWRDLEIAVEHRPDILHWGWYAMAPWAGRVSHGHLDTPHGIEELPTHLLPPHAIHGLFIESGIQLGEVSDHKALVWCDLPAPFSGGRVEQQVIVGESTMTWSVSYKNGDRAMPAWLGFHPWFRRRLARGGEVEVANPGSFMMELDSEAIPTGRIGSVAPPPWDDVFGGMRGAPTLTWPGALKITCNSTEPWWVIYTKDPMGVCVEPQSAPPHAAGLGLAPILAPGESIRTSYELIFENA